MEDNFRFKVNLGGMIDILSEHLYSSPAVYIRELLQNGMDAIQARKMLDSSYDSGSIYIDIKEKESILFSDSGTGLTEAEIHQFLAIIGESSKRDLENGVLSEEFIGRFGIGILSCFMVSDEIILKTHSVKDGSCHEWCGKPDGTYTIKETEIPDRIKDGGSSIFLKCKSGCEDYCSSELIRMLVHYYGMLLPYPITLNDGSECRQINKVYLPWEGENPNRDEILSFGLLTFGEQFFDYIPIHSESGKVDGVAYILPYEVSAAGTQNHRLYLKNMLLTEDGDGLIPEWAVFVRCILNAKALRPTASRENFYKDRVLAETRREVAGCIAAYIIELSKTGGQKFSTFLSIHQRGLKSIAIENQELFEILIPYFQFHTTQGMLNGKDLLDLGEELIYTTEIEQFNQMSQIFFAQGRLLINAGYVYDGELLHRMSELFGIKINALQEQDILALMKNCSIDELEKLDRFKITAGNVMKKYDCEVEFKHFRPDQLPVFYYVDSDAKLLRELNQAKEKSGSLFMGMLDSFASELQDKACAVLYFNYNNPIIKKLCEFEQTEQVKMVIEILYVQALMIGGFPLRNNELQVMNRKILELMEQII